MRAIPVPFTSALEGVDVVPTLRVERIGQHRGAEQVAHLAAGHADGHLVDVFRFEQVALLYGRPVDASGGTEHNAQDQDQGKGGSGKRAHAGWLLLSGVTGPTRR